MMRRLSERWSPPVLVCGALAILLSQAGCPGDGATPADGGADQATAGPGEDVCAPAPTPEGDAALCPVTVRYVPLRPVRTVSLAGAWNGFSTTAQPMTPDGSGGFSATLRLAPGVHAYKVVLDADGGVEWRLDDGNPYRKYQGGVENSGLRVPDCHRPTLRLDRSSLKLTRSGPGRGEFSAQIQVVPGLGRPPGLCSVRSSLRAPDTGKTTGTPLPPIPDGQLTLGPDRTTLRVNLTGLADGKYTVALTGVAGGRESEPLLLPFWVEQESFSFSDTPLYMAMGDRFNNGDPGNDQPVAGVIPAANYQGGDLKGIADKIEQGYFGQLGIKALWLTPFNTQPPQSFLDQSNTYKVAPYHGYWPVKARAVDPRLGGDAALHHLVETAHRHGIRILADVVLNHVHDQHEYFQDPARRSWFRTGCICGTTGCDWTEKRQSCLFASYMPDIDWTVTDASEQFIADTLYWLEEFDLDGLRVDAVKHVEDLAVFNLGARVRERFEQAGTRYYLLGETAMGWNDGPISQNRENYDTIKRYMGGVALDGQFDFVWYHANAYRVFAYDDKALLHLDYWTHASLAEFGQVPGSLMVNYLGSHDTSRFVTMATYRGQPGYDRNVAFNKWQDLPSAPPDREPYDRLWLGMVALATLPGMPLLYYGDEYGEYGGGDPDNRHMMRFDDKLGATEKLQLQRTAALLRTRQAVRGLRRGDLLSVLLGDDVYAYARVDPEPKMGALVVLNHSGATQTRMVPVPAELGWKQGMRLRDAVSGTQLTLTGSSSLMLTVKPRDAVLLVAE